MVLGGAALSILHTASLQKVQTLAQDLLKGRSRRGGLRLSSSSEAVYGINIFASETDWRVSVFDLQSAAILRTVEADPESMRAGGGDPLLDNLGEAFAALKNAERELCGGVYLCVEDPRVDFLDNRMLQFPNPDDPRITEFVQDLTGEEQCAFDRAPFGISSGDEIQRSVYAVISLTRLKQILSVTDRLAIKVRSISPAGASLLRTAQRHEGIPHGALYLGATTSTILIADAVAGSVIQRVIPAGTSTLAAALAEANSVPQDEAANALHRRNLIAKIPPPPKSTDNPSLPSGSATQNALLPVVWKIRQTIDQSLDYFSALRLVEPPHQIEVHGNFHTVTGLVDWLGHNQTVSFVKPQHRIFDEFIAQGTEKSINLLQGTDQPLIIEGRTRYFFKNGQFEPQETKTAVEPRKIGPKQRTKKKSSNDRHGSNEPENKQKRFLLLGAVALAGLVFLILDSDFGSFQKQGAAKFQALSTALAKNSNLRSRSLALRDHQETRPKTPTSAQKILWTEKFFAISSNIPNGLWISDAYLVHSKRMISDVEVVTTKFVLKGGSGAATQERLKEIAMFIARLEADEVFMRDFRRLTFEGTEALHDEPNSIIKYEIHAWYDKNKRGPGGGGKGKNKGKKSGVLGQMQNTVGDRQQQQQNFLENPNANKGGGS
jgi:hypothetical protein